MSKCAPKALFNQGLTIVDVSIHALGIGAKLTNINICIVLYSAIAKPKKRVAELIFEVVKRTNDLFRKIKFCVRLNHPSVIHRAI
jgi:hypothetical protein